MRTPMDASRRRFLSASLTAAATASTAGCLGGVFSDYSVDWTYDYSETRTNDKLVVSVTGSVQNTADTMLDAVDVDSTIVRSDNAPLAERTKTLTRIASGKSAKFEFDFPFAGDRADAVDGAVVKVHPHRTP